MTDKYDKYESMDEIDKLKFLADSPLKEIQN